MKNEIPPRILYPKDNRFDYFRRFQIDVYNPLMKIEATKYAKINTITMGEQNFKQYVEPFLFQMKKYNFLERKKITEKLIKITEKELIDLKKLKPKSKSVQKEVEELISLLLHAEGEIQNINQQLTITTSDEEMFEEMI